MRATTISTSMTAGIVPSTCVRGPAVTGSRSFRNSRSMIGTVARAPSSTAKKMPGRPCIQKKSRKRMLA